MRTASISKGMSRGSDEASPLAALGDPHAALLVAVYAATEYGSATGFPRSPWRLALLVDEILKRLDCDHSPVGAGFAVLHDPQRGVTDKAVTDVAYYLAQEGWLIPADDRSRAVWLISPGKRTALSDLWAALTEPDRAAIGVGVQRALAILEAWSKTRRA